MKFALFWGFIIGFVVLVLSSKILPNIKAKWWWISGGVAAIITAILYLSGALEILTVITIVCFSALLILGLIALITGRQI